MSPQSLIPGVQVKALFEPAPVLPGATGILGIVGITDRGPETPTAVGNMAEFIDVFGPASRFTMPELKTAFANGVFQAVVARVAPGKGQRAVLTLKDAENDPVVVFAARAEGEWGNHIGVRVTPVKTASGLAVKYVNVEIFLGDQLVETFNGLVMEEESPNYLFDRINQSSRLVVAFDGKLLDALPAARAKGPFDASQAMPATALLTPACQVTARTDGREGNRITVKVTDDRPGITFFDGAATPVALLDLRQAQGSTAQALRAEVTVATSNDRTLTITRTGGTTKSGTGATLDALIADLQDTDVEVTKLADGALADTGGSKAFTRRVTIAVAAEGQDPVIHENLATPQAITNLTDPLVKFAATGTSLPGATSAPVPLTGGRDSGKAVLLGAKGNATNLVAELLPAGASSEDVDIEIAPSATLGRVDVIVSRDNTTLEAFAGLSMEPDDPRYLIDVLRGSANLRARDLFVRENATSLPAQVTSTVRLKGGQSPSPDDYEEALTRLESAEEVDLVITSVANQLSDANVRKVQQLVVGHCTRMGDLARNRIGLGSITAAENTDLARIADHADDVRSDHFILTAPAGSEAALAGLLGRMDYFRSATFKTIASPDVSLIPYTDSQLNNLIKNNLTVITKKSGLGNIAVKSINTSGRQTSVQRVANKGVRDVYAIARNYIGLLNDAGTRNALQQQITALFLQMERDGALVPSTDGSSPAFNVAVFSTPADFSNGIVQIDLHFRPARSIDYIDATLLVQN